MIKLITRTLSRLNDKQIMTCSGINCQICVLSEENYIENPELPEERYCLKMQ